jgi:hypothetical protein
MIITQLNGGLGNQMFQYAAGRAVAEKLGVPLKLDITFCQISKLRRYALDYFAIKAQTATNEEIAHFRFPGRSLGLSIAIKMPLEYVKPYYKRRVFREQHFHYDPAIRMCGDDTYLEGYWQSEKYFKDIEQLIRNEFTLMTKPDRFNAEMADRIKSCNSVCIHVRLGDYVSSPTANANHGTCSLDYYRKAMRNIEKNVKEPHFFILSDDPAWVREHMDTGNPTTFVDINGPDKGYEDLRLMSLCQHHIIANSSFSWWGAWLSTNPQKIVIAPERWFNQSNINTQDLIPKLWIRI